MSARVMIVIVGCLVVGLSARADAQEQRRIGITTGYPGAIGLQWHAADRVAVRPEISFSKTATSSDGIVDATTDFWSLGTGVSALFFSPVTDNLRTYVGPRFSYVRTTGRNDASKSTADSYSIAGMFGAHSNSVSGSRPSENGPGLHPANTVSDHDDRERSANDEPRQLGGDTDWNRRNPVFLAAAETR
jgi:hypothetical protein